MFLWNYPSRPVLSVSTLSVGAECSSLHPVTFVLIIFILKKILSVFIHLWLCWVLVAAWALLE